MHWDGHHHIGAKYRLINTLTHRAKTVSSSAELLRNRKTADKGSPHQLQIPIMGHRQDGMQVFSTKQT